MRRVLQREFRTAALWAWNALSKRERKETSVAAIARTLRRRARRARRLKPERARAARAPVAGEAPQLRSLPGMPPGTGKGGGLVNGCLHIHKCMNCDAERQCTKPECRKLYYFDVCTTRCQTPGALRPFGLSKTAGVAPKTRRWEGKDEDVVRFVASMNLHRRHLSKEQCASIAARMADMKPHELQVAKDLRTAQAEIRAAADHRTKEVEAILDATTAGQALEASLRRARQTIAITTGGAR